MLYQCVVIILHFRKERRTRKNCSVKKKKIKAEWKSIFFLLIPLQFISYFAHLLIYCLFPDFSPIIATLLNRHIFCSERSPGISPYLNSCYWNRERILRILQRFVYWKEVVEWKIIPNPHGYVIFFNSVSVGQRGLWQQYTMFLVWPDSCKVISRL